MATRTNPRTYGKAIRGCMLVLALTLVSGMTPAWAQSGEGLSVSPNPAPRVNKALPGSRKGVMTSMKNGMVRIDRETYGLSPTVLLEDTKGQELSQKELTVYSGFEQEVQYWLGTGQAANQITQMIVQFPQ